MREMDYGEGGLGWRVWPSALLMAQWLAAHPRLVAGKSVLELGSGLGLPGLLAGRLGARKVILTDCLPNMLTKLRASIADNGLQGVVRAHLLDWVAESGADAESCAARFDTGAPTNEAYLKQQQLEAAAAADATAPAAEDPANATVGSLGPANAAVGCLGAQETFDVVMASDVM